MDTGVFRLVPTLTLILGSILDVTGFKHPPPSSDHMTNPVSADMPALPKYREDMDDGSPPTAESLGPNRVTNSHEARLNITLRGSCSAPDVSVVYDPSWTAGEPTTGNNVLLRPYFELGDRNDGVNVPFTGAGGADLCYCADLIGVMSA